MTPEALAIIAAYLMCSEAAETRLLGRSEVEACTSLYMEVNLGFVPDVSIGEYDNMSAAERAEINQQGYAGYLAWRMANPELVEVMEADAGRQLATVDHCINRLTPEKSPDPAVSPDGWGQAVGHLGETNAEVAPGGDAYNRLLRAQVNKLADMKFGPSSEKTDSQSKNDKPAPEGPQGSAASSAPKNPDDTKKQETKPRGMLGRQAVEIPDNLPRDRRVIEPENGSICACGCGMHLMGEQVIERLSYKPAEVRVIEEHYPKYVCRTCERFVQAPVPKRAFDYTRFDDSLIAGLAVSKFADFLPNYRQEQIFKRSGIRLHRSSMSRMIDEAVDALLPLHSALEVDLKSSSKLFMDETVLAQLQPGSGRTKPG